MAARKRGERDQAGEIGELAGGDQRRQQTSGNGVSAAAAAPLEEQQQVPPEEEGLPEVARRCSAVGGAGIAG